LQRLRQALATILPRQREAVPARRAKGLVELLEALGCAYHAVLEAAALFVAGAVQRQELVLAEPGTLLQHRVDQLPPGLLAARQARNLPLIVEQLVEQEADVLERRLVADHETRFPRSVAKR